VARTVVLLEDHYKAIKDSLDLSTVPIGDGVAPRGSGKAELPPPFAVLYLVSGGVMEGPLNDTQADVLLIFQITAVGTTRQQALVVLDITRTRMQKEFLTIPGRRVRDLRLNLPSSGMIRDDDLPNPLFYAYDRYELDTTPA
jgi:hypothetical protein